ncbi:hypothetical protein LC087_17145 [Bacillus carboniphilus]|uniref:Uncharacterized protein n=1 Tax=Bacillus carboniphilus TaxID=86663 RepID=A0ABY9JVB8_9BACI|nr:hypothetical protein [Bacillus carboniphilus]WLR42407.1 hypothetical protein LC087_17145 [Bacillus carboniphilus]
MLYPQMIIELKTPTDATLIYGIEKVYSNVAIRVDEPEKFYRSLNEQFTKSELTSN